MREIKILILQQSRQAKNRLFVLLKKMPFEANLTKILVKNV